MAHFNIIYQYTYQNVQHNGDWNNKFYLPTLHHNSTEGYFEQELSKYRVLLRPWSTQVQLKEVVDLQKIKSKVLVIIVVTF